MKDQWLEDFKNDLDRLGTARTEHKLETVKLKAGERKTVTILFLDLKGFTSMSEKLDPEELHAIIDPCFKIFTRDIERFGGYIDKYEGDCIMALFGVQRCSEFDAELAARSALCMHAHLVEINQVLKGRELNLGMRIGINTGLVATGPVGKERPGDFTVYGDAVNLASRLESNAPVGKVMISDEVFRLIKDKFDCTSFGDIQVKGKSEPVHTYIVEGEQNQALERWERSCSFESSHFVNRHQEVGVIQRWLSMAEAQLPEKTSAVFAIRGSAGIGKSRLLNHCQSLGEGQLYFKTRCMPYESSYFPFYALISGVLEYLGAARNALDQESLLRGMERFLPAEDQPVYLDNLPYLQNLLRTSSLEIPEEDPKERQLKFLLAIRYFFQAFLNYSHQQNFSLVLLFDDVQWIDMASREALIFLMDQFRSEALQGIIIVCRDGFEFNSLLPVGLQCPLLHVDPLDENHCRELLEKMIGKDVIPPAITQTLLTLCQGNPYFLEEILICFCDRNYLVRQAGGWQWTQPTSQVPIPNTLESLLLNRIDSLPRTLKETIQVASVLGRRFDRTILAEVLPHLGISTDSLNGHLNQLTQLGIVSPEAVHPNEYLFSQNLLHQVVYHSLLHANRKILHKLAAESFPRQTLKEQEQFAHTVAHHYLLSSTPELALPSVILTVQQMVRDFRTDEAVYFVNQGLNLFKDREFTPEDHKHFWNLLVEREKIAELMSDHPAHQKILDQLREIALKEGDPKKLAETQNRSSWLAISTGKYDLAIAEAEKVLNETELQGSTLVAEALRNLGLSYYNLGNYKEAETRFRQALELRKAFADVLGEARELASIGAILWQKGEYRAAVDHLKQSLIHRKEKGDLRGMAHVLNNLGLIVWSIGEFALATKYYDQALTIYRQVGDRRGEGNTLSNLSLVLYYQGRLSEAVDHAWKALELGERYQLFRVRINGRNYLAMMLMEQEPGAAQLAEVESLLASAMQEATATNYSQGLMEGATIKARFLELTGRMEEAYESSRKALELMQSMDSKNDDVYWIHSQIAFQVGKDEEALDTLGRAFEMIASRKEEIQDPEAQKLYLAGDPYRKKILEWWEKKGRTLGEA